MGGLDRMIDSQKEKGIATGDPEADDFLRSNPDAILIAILLDQQVRAEYAFSGPHKLYQRLGHLSMPLIADMNPDEFKDVFSQKPAVHRFSNMMANRVQSLAKAITEKYDGEAANIWNDGVDLRTVKKRVGKLPGFGKSKVNMIGPVLELFEHRTFDEV